jgi:hypothetical protein
MTKQVPYIGVAVRAGVVMAAFVACAADTSPRSNAGEAGSLAASTGEPGVQAAGVEALVACNTGTSRPFDQPPVNGTAIPVAGGGATFEAEHFNCGGEGEGYHDLTTTNNPGQTFRPDEGVEIIAVAAGGLSTNQFDVGDWMAYTIDVASAGTYDLGVLASSSPSGGGTGAFRIEVDGIDVTGSVSVPSTSGWEDYRWFEKPGVALGAGTHTLVLVALGTYFRSDKLRIVPGVDGDGCTRAGLDLCVRFEAPPDTRFQGIDFACHTSGRCNEIAMQTVGGASFTGFVLNQANNQCNGDRADDATRIAPVNGGRDGGKAIKFTTQDLDNKVHTSCTPPADTWERSMMELTKQTTAASQGVEQWWAHSIYLPAGFTMPPTNWNANLFLEFHRTRVDGVPGGSLPMINLNLFKQPGSVPRTVIRVIANGAGGVPGSTDGRQYTYSVPGAANIGGHCIHDNPVTGVWYDFVHHIRWSATGDGFHEMWMREGNGTPKKVLDKRNLNALLNTSEQSYLVIGTYHDPQPGVTTSIIHDRIRRGNSFAAVAMPDFAMPSGGVTMCAGATTP